MSVVTDHTGELYDQPVFWRSAPTSGVPTLYVHGVPTNSDDWVPFLERAGGVAPDLPGFGRTGKRGDGDFTMEGYDRFIEDFLELIGLDGPINLVVHDWGVVGLLWAMRFPERIHRLVVMDTVPIGQVYRWHWIARVWRTPILGELSMGSTNRFTVSRLLRPATPLPGSMPAPFISTVVDHLDQGTQRAILRLYRTSPPEKLLAAGKDLGELSGPALIVWGEQDPYIDPDHADRFAEALPGASVRRVDRAGHWPWIDQPDLIDEVCGFLSDA